MRRNLLLALPLILASSYAATAQIPSGLRLFLQKGVDPDKLEQVQAVQTSLNDKDQVWIIYRSGPYFCGSGGCNLLVLRQSGNTFHVLADTTITRKPIRRLATITNGWHDLGVLVAGGGISGHEARLMRKGIRYPSNPSLAPKCIRCAGTILLDEHTPSEPLFP